MSRDKVRRGRGRTRFAKSRDEVRRGRGTPGSTRSAMSRDKVRRGRGRTRSAKSRDEVRRGRGTPRRTRSAKLRDRGRGAPRTRNVGPGPRNVRGSSSFPVRRASSPAYLVPRLGGSCSPRRSLSLGVPRILFSPTFVPGVPCPATWRIFFGIAHAGSGNAEETSSPTRNVGETRPVDRVEYPNGRGVVCPRTGPAKGPPASTTNTPANTAIYGEPFRVPEVPHPRRLDGPCHPAVPRSWRPRPATLADTRVLAPQREQCTPGRTRSAKCRRERGTSGRTRFAK